MVFLATLGIGAGYERAYSDGAGAQNDKDIQCACCWERKDGYPRVHCAFFCDKGGRFDLIYFAPGSSELTSSAKKTLRKQAVCLKRNKFGATLFASADAHETPDKKKARTLSERRAAAVRMFFASSGVPQSAIKLEPEGLEGQGTAGRTPEHRRRNRYVRTKHRRSWD